MNDVKNFWDLTVWQLSKSVAREIYLLTDEQPFSKDFRFTSQIRAAAVSVMSNIAEGFERGSAADFHHFLVIAKASCAEMRSQLFLAQDIGYLQDTDSKRMYAQTESLARMIGALKASVKLRITK